MSDSFSPETLCEEQIAKQTQIENERYDAYLMAEAESRSEDSALQLIFDNPPFDLEIGGKTYFITDPLGEHDWAINFSSVSRNRTQFSTFNGCSIEEIYKTSKSNDGEILIELFLRSDKSNTDTPSGEIVFKTRNYPQFKGLNWKIVSIDDDEWEMTSVYKLRKN